MDKNRSTRYTKRKWKAYEELTLADDFLFCKVMQNPKICKEVLERILGKEVTSISYPEAQHTIDITIEGKGIRLDIVVADSMGTYYDLEMQQRDTKELPKRMRYYTSAIDQELLKRSEDYHTLNDVVIIFICPFDLFGAGKAKYVIHSYTEDHYLVADGCTKVVLNAKGKADTKELQSFLDYLEGK
ncbi:Rpn family recombination-promoting nuclease/putative transposase [Drancourtella sp. An12]|uniref:Rpn family recombination-promoting nuclease/putative transposase n=1 Tax=Drancourtella sp. An12 TaxID=1965548 RepID=UPI0013A627B3|nr:Rpn family recombination-promoting nuclease/putative transposase [Drancourtella sp. An12]